MPLVCPFYDDTEWLFRDVRQFHEQYARQPDDSEARRILELNTNEIDRALRQDVMCHHLEYTGSSYDGVKVCKATGNPDHEYDVMIIMPGGNTLKACPTERPGYAILMKRQNQDTAVQLGGRLVDTDPSGNLLSAGVRRRFVGKIQRIINDSTNMRRTSQLIDHGPAVQIDVYGDQIGGRKLYSVDMVPAFEVDGCLYVAKPLPGEPMADAAWRQSFSLREKQLIKNVDGSDNGCRKQVLRVLKTMRNRDTTLQGLTSYHFKTAWLKVIRNRTTSGDWNQNKMGQRMIDVLQELHKDLYNRLMQSYFDPHVNLLSTYSSDTLCHTKNRVSRLVTSEKALKALINFRE